MVYSTGTPATKRGMPTRALGHATSTKSSVTEILLLVARVAGLQGDCSQIASGIDGDHLQHVLARRALPGRGIGVDASELLGRDLRHRGRERGPGLVVAAGGRAPRV